MFTYPLLLAIYAGFAHAFEADHLLAVNGIVAGKNNMRLCIKDGMYWGLGHASTLITVGLLVLIFNAFIPPQYYAYFEAVVGITLILLGIIRLGKYLLAKKITHTHNIATHLKANEVQEEKKKHSHNLAYGIGLLHGLAGSGALVMIVLANGRNAFNGLSYLVIFGAGCIAGMMLASGFFSVPYSKKIMHAPQLQTALIIISSLLCIVFGLKVVYENLLP